MADTKISNLTAYNPPISTDLFPIVDVTTSTTKKTTFANVEAALTVANQVGGTASGSGNIVRVTGATLVTPTLGDAVATSFSGATNTSLNFKSGIYNSIQTYTPGIGNTATLDLSKGNIHHVTMPGGNITLAISNGTAGQIFIVRILQDGSGSRTVTWFTTIKWAGGSAPTLTTTASKADTLGFEVTGSNTYDGFIVGMNL